MQATLDIYKYSDYRHYLKDFFEQKKRVNPRYSLAVFANRGQLGSRSYVSLIVDGKRNMGLPTVYKFAKALDLTDREFQYFMCLVSFNQAKSESEKEEFYEALRELKPQTTVYPEEERQERFFADWRLPVLYTLLSGEPAPRSPAWVQAHFRPKLKLPEVKALLAELDKLQFAKSSGGLWSAEPVQIKSSDEKASYSLRAFHRAMIELAKEAVALPIADREIASATVKVTREDFEAAKTKLKEIRDLLCRDSAPTSNGRAQSRFVAQLNFQLFPISEVIESNFEPNQNTKENK